MGQHVQRGDAACKRAQGWGNCHSRASSMLCPQVTASTPAVTEYRKTHTATKTKQEAHKDGLRLPPVVQLLLVTSTAMSHVPMRLFPPKLCNSDRVESVLSSYPDEDGMDKPLEGMETVGVWRLLQKHIWTWERCPKAEFGAVVPKPLTQHRGILPVRLAMRAAHHTRGSRLTRGEKGQSSAEHSQASLAVWEAHLGT